MNIDFLPTPLTVTIDRVQATDGNAVMGLFRGVPTFEATSPDHPGLSTSSTDAAMAVRELIRRVLHEQPLAPVVVEAMRNAGYSTEVLRAWDRETRFQRDLKYRHVADEAVSALKEYTDAGVPPLVACELFNFLDAKDAAMIQTSGATLEDVRAYAGMSATEHGWDFDIMPWLLAGLPHQRGGLYVDHCSVEQAIAWETVVEEREVPDGALRGILRLGLTRELVDSGFPTDRTEMYADFQVPTDLVSAWEAVVGSRPIADADLRDVLRLGLSPAMVLSGFPVHRAAFYADCRVSPKLAVGWEAVLSKHEISDMDLRDILRAGVTPNHADEQAANDANVGQTLGDAARLLLAFPRPQASGDLWANPWGDSEEPPF